jgi:molybdopterin-guanine dinucleotide biosynthesis protein A
MNITCAILAGGCSTRMGQDKVTLEINGKALINYVFDRVKNVFQNIVIVSNNHNAFKDINAPVIKDALPVRGSIVGVVSALMYSHDPYVFVCACDMPFMHENTIRYMINEINGEDIIIPKTKKGYEPLCAIYSRACIPHMLTNIKCNRLKIAGIFPVLTVKTLRDHPSFYNNGYPVFTNINAAADLEMLSETIVKLEMRNAQCETKK